jgi:GAF domain-containing protein
MKVWQTVKKRMLRLIALRAVYPRAAERQQAQRVLIINLAWMLVMVLALPIIIWWASDDGIDAVTVFVPLSLGIGMLNHRLIRGGRLQWARLLFVLNILVASVLTIFPGYRVDTPFIMIFALPLIAAGVLLPRSGLLGIAVVLVLVVVVGGLVQLDTDMEPTPLGSTLESIRATIIIMIGIVFLGATMLWVFVNSMEDTLQQQQHLVGLVEATHKISQTLLELPSQADALERAVEQVRDTFDLYHVQVFLADPASGLPVLRVSTGFIGRRLLEEESLLSPGEESPINDAMRQQDPILIREFAPEEQRSGFLPATRSELLIPLRVGDRMPFGVLDLHSAAPDVFSANVTHVLAVISNQMAAALYGVQRSDELQAGFEERDRLVQQLDAAQREQARLNRQLISATWGTYLAGRGAAVPGFVWRAGTISRSETQSDLMKQTLEDGQPRLEHRAGVDVLCVPIRLRGQTLGVLEFRRKGSPGWSPPALEMAQAVAERLALSQIGRASCRERV